MALEKGMVSAIALEGTGQRADTTHGTGERDGISHSTSGYWTKG